MTKSTESPGVWIDADTGKVVASQPERGVQLAAPGCPSTPNGLAAIEHAKANAQSYETATAGEAAALEEVVPEVVPEVKGRGKGAKAAGSPAK